MNFIEFFGIYLSFFSYISLKFSIKKGTSICFDEFCYLYEKLVLFHFIYITSCKIMGVSFSMIRVFIPV